jgi:putative ABC transport system permease protein
MGHGLFGEIVGMALDTLRAHKLRSALTVVGIVIGITSLVGMISLIRGLDGSLRESIQSIGPDTIFVARFSAISLSSGSTFTQLMRRPHLTPADARALESQSSTLARVGLVLGEGGPPTQQRLFYKGARTKPINILGTSEDYPAIFHIEIIAGRFLTHGEVQHRRAVVVLGQTPAQALFPNLDPIGKTVRIGAVPYVVIGVFGNRPSPAGFNVGQDDFAVIPHTAYQKQFGLPSSRMPFGRLGEMRSIIIAAVPRTGVPREASMRDVERIMRIRHGLRLDQPNDFDLLTQDAALRLWEQVSSAIFLALVVIASIALMVGGIGVMAIMTISVTERTREIGTRKALGARRQDILWQFLLEAVFLTALGGMLGIVLGSGVGLGVHYASGFPISLPWWSFALGAGFSALVGIVFGLAPAVKASALDPIDALRYE